MVILLQIREHRSAQFNAVTALVRARRQAEYSRRVFFITRTARRCAPAARRSCIAVAIFPTRRLMAAPPDLATAVVTVATPEVMAERVATAAAEVAVVAAVAAVVETE